MRQTYFISQTHKIESDENGQFTKLDINLALAHIAGWQLHQLMPMGDAIVKRQSPDGKELTAFIPAVEDMDQVEKLAQTYGLGAILPLKTLGFAQVMMKSFPCVITPITSNSGALMGAWKVESVGNFGAGDIYRAGWDYGMNEYTDTLSDSLAEAICLNVLSRAGIGKMAFFYYPEMTTSEGELMYLSQRTIQQLSPDTRAMACLVAAPELDCYAMIPPPADVLADARVLADAEAVLNKVALKAELDAAQVEADAAQQPVAEVASGADAVPVPQDVATDAPGMEGELVVNVVVPVHGAPGMNSEPVEVAEPVQDAAEA